MARADGGTSTPRSRFRNVPASTSSHSRPAPARNAPTCSSGFWVAERPTRWTGRPQSASSRSTDSARCEPRLSRTSAWISSTISVRVVASMARPPCEVSSRYSDSGVVTRMCGGLRVMAARSLAGVSPVRTSTRISGRPGSSARIWASGPCRFFWTSFESARSGET